MMRWTIIICILVSLKALQAQHYFNITPDVGGVDMEGWGTAIISDSLSIFAFGHRYDTTYPGFTSLPWIAEFTYSGDLIRVNPIVDSLYELPFQIDDVHVTRKSGDVYYILARRFVGDRSYPYVIALNVRTGQVLNSVLIKNPHYPEIGNSLADLEYDQDNTITLLLYGNHLDSRFNFIVELDTLFQRKKFLGIEDPVNHRTPQALKINADHTYSIVGLAVSWDIYGTYSYNTYYLKSDTSGNVLDSKLSPAPIPVGQIIARSKTVEVDETGNWVIAGQQYISYPDSCGDCEDLIPYIFSVSSDFSEALWQTRFLNIPVSTNPGYYVYGLTKIHDGFIGVGDYLLFKPWPATYWPAGGYLFKTSNAGDSLWVKHYIPLNWEEKRVFWAQLNAVNATPYGGIIATGALSDRELGIIRPWALHLDSDGCLVPGCNEINSTADNSGVDSETHFKIYPNPASDELYLLSSISTNDPLKLQIISNSGEVIKARELTVNEGYQYILPIDDLPPGIYYLALSGNPGLVAESHVFIKL